MIRPIRILLVFGAALVSILRCAGAQENQVKKTQGRPATPVSGSQTVGILIPTFAGRLSTLGWT